MVDTNRPDIGRTTNREPVAPVPTARAVDARSLLLGGAAHELNNIFAQTLLLAEVLAVADLDAELKQMLTSLQSSVQRGILVVERLVEQSHLQPGQAVRLDPRHLISAVHKRSEGLVGERVRISHRYPEEVADIEAEPQLLLETLLDVCRATATELISRSESPRIDVMVCVENESGDQRVLLGATAPPNLVESGLLEPGTYFPRPDLEVPSSGELLDDFCRAAEELGARACVRRESRGDLLALAFVAAE